MVTKTLLLLKKNDTVFDYDLYYPLKQKGVVVSISPVIIQYFDFKVKYTIDECKKYLVVINQGKSDVGKGLKPFEI